MNAGFIGAGSGADRRRRRLAQDAERGLSTSKGRSAPPRAAAHAAADEATDTSAAPVPLVARPRESMIPFSPIRIGAIIAGGIALWMAMLWIGLTAGSGESAFREILSLENRRLPRFFSTICLLSATQLALLILWYRIRSRKDFGGRYRIWWLASVFFGVACCCVTTDLHLAFARWVQRHWAIEMWRAETLHWLIPTAISFLALHRLVQLDMRHSRPSRIAWDITWWCAAAAAIAMMCPGAFASAEYKTLLIVSSATLWHLMTVFALLIHARFVVHITNECAPKKPSRMVRVMHSAHATAERLAIGLPRPKFLERLKFRRGTASGSTDESTKKPAAKPSKAAKTAAAAKVDNSATASAASSAAPAARSATAAPPAPARSAAPSSPSSVRIDPPHVAAAPVSRSAPVQEIDDDSDGDDSDGLDDDSQLSRKERRRLKKQQRAARRA